METRQIEYILKIAEENNITKAAEKLFITQPALNQQLLRLEKELGTPLFYRSRTNWRPTPAGEIYLENARQMLRIKKNTYQMIGDMVDARHQSLSVGFVPGRGINMFSTVYPAFHQEYPEIIIEPFELSVRKQLAQIESGELSIGFLTLFEQQRTNDFEYLPICTEEMVLVLPKAFPLADGAVTPASPYPILDIRTVREEPFVIINKESTSRLVWDQIFEAAGFAPRVLFETASYATILRMIQANLCCGILPEYYIKKQFDSVSCFSLPTRPCWETVAAYKKGTYLSLAARHFIGLASNYLTW